MPFNTQPPYNVTIVDDVTLTRAIGVQYTNNTGRTLFVFITVYCVCPLNTDQAKAKLLEAGVVMGEAGYSAQSVVNGRFMMSTAVRPGDTYQVVSFLIGTGTVSLSEWIESY